MVNSDCCIESPLCKNKKRGLPPLPQSGYIRTICDRWHLRTQCWFCVFNPYCIIDVSNGILLKIITIDRILPSSAVVRICLKRQNQSYSDKICLCWAIWFYGSRNLMWHSLILNKCIFCSYWCFHIWVQSLLSWQIVKLWVLMDGSHNYEYHVHGTKEKSFLFLWWQLPDPILISLHPESYYVELSPCGINDMPFYCPVN